MEVVRSFIYTEFIHPFGITQIFVSDNAQCFTVVLMKEFTAQHGIEWKTVSSFAPISNGWAERMVQTVKAGVEKTARDHEKD